MQREMQPDAALVRLSGVQAWRWGLRLLRDALSAARQCHYEFGPLVAISDALPFFRPRLVVFGIPLVLAVGAGFAREIFEDPATWRPVSLLPGGPRNSAARRLKGGLMRMTGPTHAHYRKLLAAPLRRAAVDATGDEMARLAEQEIASWPVGATIDLWEYSRRALRNLAIGLLFGGDRQSGYPIADMIAQVTERKWAPGSAIPVNLPFTPFRRMLRESDALESRILAWGETKRGQPAERDLAAIIVNSPDVDGNPPTSATIVGQIPSLYAGATEAGQSTLFWTLILLAQHPRIAQELLDELHQRLNGNPLTMLTIAGLPRLDAVVKESMRLFTPVPLQMRIAQREATLAGQPLPKETRLVLSSFLTNRMPDLYPEPDRFIPQRWSTIDPSPFEFLAFSAGPRICPGYWFGLNAIKVALAAILMRYGIVFEPNTRIDYAVQPTLRPRGRVPVKLRPQDGSLAAVSIRGNIHHLLQL